MRILLITQLFQPEPSHLRGLAFVKRLLVHGHLVQVLTGFPNIPGGRVYPGYKIRWRRKEHLEGIEVVRVAHYPSHDASGLKRFLNYFTFAVAASTIGLFSVKPPNVVYVSQGPATLMMPAIFMKLLFHSRIVLDVQDLWPESVISSNMLHVPGAVWLLRRWCMFTYRVSDRIIVLSEGYKQLIMNQDVREEKIKVIYNWCDETSLASLERDENIGNHFGLLHRFNVVFAGTMGKVQALDAVLEAAELIRNDLPEVQVILVGGGLELPHLKNLAARLKLPNVKFIDRQPISEISKILAFSDVMLVHLRRDALGRVGIPQKTQAYLAAGKPILAAVEGEAAEIVQSAHAGVACTPEDAQSIAAAIRLMVAMPPSDRKSLGENGRGYYYERMSFNKGVQEVLDTLRSACEDGNRR